MIFTCFHDAFYFRSEKSLHPFPLRLIVTEGPLLGKVMRHHGKTPLGCKGIPGGNQRYTEFTEHLPTRVPKGWKISVKPLS